MSDITPVITYLRLQSFTAIRSEVSFNNPFPNLKPIENVALSAK
jgi:hypothetical protein